MIIREPDANDKKAIDELYKKYFSHNEYPDFYNKDAFPQPFVITDTDEKIIVAGGVKKIVEVVVVSDQSQSPRVRLEALLQCLGSSIYIAQEMKQNQLHVFSNDEKYIKVLQKFGFKLMDVKLLILDLGVNHG